MARVGHDKTCGHIERRCLAGTVRSEQSDNLALLHVDRNVVNNGALSVALHQSLGTQHHAFALLHARIQIFFSVHLRL